MNFSSAVDSKWKVNELKLNCLALNGKSIQTVRSQSAQTCLFQSEFQSLRCQLNCHGYE